MRRSFDLRFLFLPLFLSLFGVIFIYSGTAATASLHYVKMQLLALLLGLLFFWILVQVNYKFYQEIALPLFFTGLIMLVMVLLFGKATGGSRRWLSFFGFTFQPSEFAKIFFLVVMAKLFDRVQGDGLTFLSHSLFFLFPYILTLLVQPDLGTSLVFFVIWASLLLMSSLPRRAILALFGLIVLITPLGFHFLKDYQKNRLLVFINPQADPLGASYHLIQSKIAVGSGGIFGRGFFQGTQSQLHFIPGTHTDFIFSLIAEELGFAGAVALLVLFLVFFLSTLELCLKTEDCFGKALALGIFTFLFFQFSVNIGMTMGLMPITGIPLPFISYGGSALISSWIACALLAQISISRRIKL